MPGSNDDQVLVLAGSIGGLLAARVLAERFERVVVVERDPLPQTGEHRRGVPHGRHLHGLHPLGRPDRVLRVLRGGGSLTNTS